MSLGLTDYSAFQTQRNKQNSSFFYFLFPFWVKFVAWN